MNSSDIMRLLEAVIPTLISAIVAYIQWRDKQDFQRQVDEAKTRIAVLEQILIDHGIPVPPINP